MTDFEASLCRGCAFPSPDNESLFRNDSGSGAHLQLTDAGLLLAECLSAEITPNDGYPAMLCVQCKNQLETFDKFRSSVQRIHRHYTRRLKRKLCPPVELIADKFTTKDSENEVILDVSVPIKVEKLISHVKAEHPDSSTDQKQRDGFESAIDQPQSDEIEIVQPPSNGVELAIDVTPSNGAESPSIWDVRYIEDEEFLDDGVEDEVDMVDVKVEENDLKLEYSETEYLSDEKMDEDYLKDLDEADDLETGTDPLDQRDESFDTSQKPNEKSELYRCEKCLRSYKNRRYARMHVCNPSKKSMFKCPVCEMVLKLTRIDAHMALHPGYDKRHSDDDLNRKKVVNREPKPARRKYVTKTQFNCDECFAQFSSERALTYHICTDEDKCRFRCELCENSFKTIGCLDEHMMRHTGLRSFTCEECSKSFKTPADLYVHRKIHTSDLRKYICDTCGYACRSSSHLANHVIIHSDDRPFQCSMCDKTFKRKDMLDGHVRSLHTNKSDHVCHVCQASFGLKQRLKRHLKIHVRKGELQEESEE